MEEINIYKIGFNGDKARLILPYGYEFKAEGNEVFVIKKKSKYPKTYVECAILLDTFCGSIEGYNGKLLHYFQQLLICRNAYWKIAGEEMGLGKPWEPDFGNESEYKYGIFRLRNIIYKDATSINPKLLVFPTKEIRDAFYENFEDLIEGCKELV